MKPSDLNSNIEIGFKFFNSSLDQGLRVISVYVFGFCILAFIGRLLSHIFPVLATARDIRFFYFVECLFLLALAWKYKARGPLVMLLVVASVFNPIVPLRIGSWTTWQVIDFVGLISIGLSGIGVMNARKKLQAPFDLAYAEYVRSLPSEDGD